MSHVADRIERDCPAEPGCGAVLKILQPKAKDLGEFSVRRALPTLQRRMVGPWIFFDHMGPASFAAGEGINVRPHPHIGIATVTYLFEGEILHRDSLGSLQAIRPGDLNLMVAGAGIVHSERERPEVRGAPHRLHGLQLWMALPDGQEEIEPAFYHHPSAELPVVTVDSVAVRVMMGSAYGVRSPVKSYGDALYLEASLRAGQTIELPDAPERAVYVASGNLTARDNTIAQHTMAVLAAGEGVVMEATEDTRMVLIGGPSTGPRFIEWNFVSSRKERIEQAKRDWRSGRFAKVPGDERDFIPLPEPRA